MKIICTKCKGQKSYRMMGGINVICKDCNGVGQVDVEVEPETIEKVKKHSARDRWRDKTDGG